MKKNIFFVIFLFFFSIFLNPVFANTKCDYKSYDIEDFSFHNNIKYLEVEFENNREWIVNSLKIGIGNFRFIPENYKRNFSGKIKVHYKNNNVCVHKARIRFSGDMKDHVDIDLAKNKISQSVDVKLLEGNILGITNFKLLLKKTRGEDEIFISELFKNLGYLAPRTYLTKVKINNQKIEMLFQEKNRKELLELNKRRETVILEGDERFIFLASQSVSLDNRSNHEAGLVPLLKAGFKTMLAKQKNSNLILRNKNLEIMSINVLSNLNRIYLKYLNNFDKNSNELESYRFYTLDNELLGFQNKKNILFLDIYNLIIMASSDGHSLMPSNRQFYWNSFEHFFEPVSYDGNFKINNNQNNLIEPLSIYFYNTFDIFEKIIENLDVVKLNQNINDNGLKQSLKKTREKIKNLRENVDILKIKFIKKKEKKLFLEDHGQASLKDYFRNTKKIGKDIKIIKINKDNEFEACSDFQSCEVITLSKEDLRNLLRAELEMKNQPYQFVGKIYADKDFINDLNFKFQKYKNTNILYDSDIKIAIKEDINEIDIFQNKENAKIVFLNGNLENIKINFNGVENINTQRIMNKFNTIDVNGLTGCLSIINSKVDNLKLNSNNSSCEDSINLINTTGFIDEIMIKNSLSDGLDIDFSKLKINSIEIENSNNDCADFSFGNYEINKIILNNCGDKGMSVGEKSLLKSSFATINNSNIGVASKDSSSVYLDNININTVETCLAAYNKKQEFHGGLIKIKNLNCSKFSKLKSEDKMSNILVNKEELQSALKIIKNIK